MWKKCDKNDDTCKNMTRENLKTCAKETRTFCPFPIQINKQNVINTHLMFFFL